MGIEKDKRDVALLDEAIDQWKKRLERFKKGNLAWRTHIGERCPLCNVYADRDDCCIPYADCDDCCISNYGCEGTPYIDVDKEFHKCNTSASENLLKHTQAEIDFLTSLRKEIAERIKDENASKT